MIDVRPDAPRLRVVGLDDCDPRPSACPPAGRLTLSGCYLELYAPARNHAPETVSCYRTALRHWEAHSEDPPLDEIDVRAINAWAHRLRDEGLVVQTVRKYYRHLRAILNHAHELELISRVPKWDQFGPDRHQRKTTRRVVPLSKLGAIFDACRVAVWPAQHPAPWIWWKALYLVSYNLGLRTDDLLQLTWEDLVRTSACPAPDLELDNPHGWLVLTPQKTRRSKGPLMLPLNRYTRAAFDRLARLFLGNWSRIFEAPNSPGVFRRQRNRIQAAAGLVRVKANGELRADSPPPFHFQELRKTASRAFNSRGIHDGRPLGQYLLGQAPRTVNAEFYDQPLAELTAAAQQLEQPPEFSGIFTT